ncbi:MAG: ATP-binding protein [Acidobacteriota bacterium]
MIPRSIRARLAAVALGAIVLSVLLTAVFADVLFRRSLWRGVAEDLGEGVDVALGGWHTEYEELGSLDAAARELTKEFALQGRELSFVDPAGKLIAGVPPPGDLAIDLAAAPRSVRRIAGNRAVMVAPLRLAPGASPAGFVAIQMGLSDFETTVRNLHVAIAESLIAALLLGGIGACVVVSRSLAPLRVMAGRAREILATRSDGELPVPDRRDEIRDLAIAFNDLLAGERAALARQRQLVADASHELRTPLAALRAELDVSAGRARSADELGTSLALAGESLRKVERVVDDLFLLARCDEGSLERAWEFGYLSDVANATAAMLATLAATSGQKITVDAGSEGFVRGDERLLGRLVANLVENAIKYGKPGGAIKIATRQTGSRVELSVADDGPGIPADHLPRIFDRFYRADPARPTEQGGAGLGLSIVREIARMHGGDVSVESVVGAGSRFAITLPMADGDAAPESAPAGETPRPTPAPRASA